MGQIDGYYKDQKRRSFPCLFIVVVTCIFMSFSILLNGHRVDIVIAPSDPVLGVVVR